VPLRLSSRRRVGAIQDLALQVGEIDLVGVGQRQPADARRGEIEGRRAAEPPRDDRALPSAAVPAPRCDLGEQDVPAVAEELLVVQLLSGRCGLGLRDRRRLALHRLA